MPRRPASRRSNCRTPTSWRRPPEGRNRPAPPDDAQPQHDARPQRRAGPGGGAAKPGGVLDHLQQGARLHRGDRRQLATASFPASCRRTSAPRPRPFWSRTSSAPPKRQPAEKHLPDAGAAQPARRPDYFVSRIEHIADVIARSQTNLKIMYDFYHVQVMQGDVLKRRKRHLPLIGHVQFAGPPARVPPQHGELNYPVIFDAIDAMGWKGLGRRRIRFRRPDRRQISAGASRTGSADGLSFSFGRSLSCMNGAAQQTASELATAAQTIARTMPAASPSRKNRNKILRHRQR